MITMRKAMIIAFLPFSSPLSPPKPLPSTLDCLLLIPPPSLYLGLPSKQTLSLSLLFSAYDLD